MNGFSCGAIHSKIFSFIFILFFSFNSANFSDVNSLFSVMKGLSTTANYIKNSLSSTSSAVSTGTGEAVEMTSLLSESTVAEGLTAAETLSVTEGAAVVATEGAVIGVEVDTAVVLAP